MIPCDRLDILHAIKGKCARDTRWVETDIPLALPFEDRSYVSGTYLSLIQNPNQKPSPSRLALYNQLPSRSDKIRWTLAPKFDYLPLQIKTVVA